MREMITLPGIGGSGGSHWQTLWEEADPAFTRFQPSSWDQPDLDNWIQSVERSVAACEHAPVLVAHSLACLVVAHWASWSRSKIAGAFLVSVPDPSGPEFPIAASAFKRVSTTALPFPSIIVASSNDPYGTSAYMRHRSSEWRSGLVVAGELGHINGSSGLGDWPQGRMLLEAFIAGLPRID